MFHQCQTGQVGRMTHCGPYGHQRMLHPLLEGFKIFKSFAYRLSKPHFDIHFHPTMNFRTELCYIFKHYNYNSYELCE